jgi:hypothetical protein
VVALKGVLGCPRRGENYPAAAVGPEALLQVQLRLPFGAVGERAAVAAIQENDLTASAGVFEPFIQP